MKEIQFQDKTMIKRFLSPHLPSPHFPVPLSEAEARHAIQVLRLREGDQVEVIDGKGNLAIATLRLKGDIPRLEFIPPSQYPIDQRLQRSVSFPLTLEISVLKGEAMEWVVEKSVELGVQTLTPVITDRTVVQMKRKKPEEFRDRWQKIADQALKQCGRLDRLEISPPVSFKDLFLQTAHSSPFVRIWCDEKSYKEAPHLLDFLKLNVKQLSPLKILIGPEGGWSESERELLNQTIDQTQCFRVELGPLILRAETAALFAISLVTAHYKTSS